MTLSLQSYSYFFISSYSLGGIIHVPLLWFRKVIESALPTYSTVTFVVVVVVVVMDGDEYELNESMVI